MGSVVTVATSVSEAVLRSGFAAPAPVASTAAESRAGSVPARERRTTVARIEERSSGRDWMELSQDEHPGA
eukprot:15319918-Alexandrium_andersonii.AAC.1